MSVYNNLREQLIETGFWSADDSRDPSFDGNAAEDLKRTCEGKFQLELDVHQERPEATEHSPGDDSADLVNATENYPWRVYLVSPSPQKLIAEADEKAAAICQAALELCQTFDAPTVSTKPYQ